MAAVRRQGERAAAPLSCSPAPTGWRNPCGPWLAYPDPNPNPKPKPKPNPSPNPNPLQQAVATRAACTGRAPPPPPRRSGSAARRGSSTPRQRWHRHRAGARLRRAQWRWEPCVRAGPSIARAPAPRAASCEAAGRTGRRPPLRHARALSAADALGRSRRYTAGGGGESRPRGKACPSHAARTPACHLERRCATEDSCCQRSLLRSDGPSKRRLAHASGVPTAASDACARRVGTRQFGRRVPWTRPTGTHPTAVSPEVRQSGWARVKSKGRLCTSPDERHAKERTVCNAGAPCRGRRPPRQVT